MGERRVGVRLKGRCILAVETQLVPFCVCYCYALKDPDAF